MVKYPDYLLGDMEGFIMGMFYVMYLGNECDFNTLKQKVVEITPNIRSKSDDRENFNVNCDFFSLSIKEGGTPVTFKSEDYNDKFNFQFWFDVHYNTTDWAVELMKFVGILLKSFDGSVVLESNGDIPIVVRKDGTITVDDKELKGTQKFPFDGLNLKYQKGDLKQV